MTPDTKRIDRSFVGVGRIAKASGTTDPRTFAAMLRMLDTLHSEGNLQVLRELRDGTFPPLVLYDAYRRNALHELPSKGTAGKLADAMRQWLSGLTDADATPEHRRGLGYAIQRLERAMKDANVQQAADALRLVRQQYAKQPRAFNLTRSALQAFLRDTVTKAHPVYHQVAAVPGRRVPKGKRFHPLTPDEMREQFPAPESDPVDAIVWTMATTGMGPGELWGSWRVLSDRVRIDGTKREGRRREVPLVMQPQRPTLSRKAFEQRLKRREGVEARPYDFRRTYANWLESAGVNRTRRVIYMGHGTGDITSLYERHDATRYLVADAELVRGVIGLRPTESPTVRLRVIGGADA